MNKPFCLDVKYEGEVTSDYCADNSDPEEYKNICDGTKNDCVVKGKAKCSNDVKCMGIMYNAASWGPYYKGVKVCTSRRMTKKGDWFTYLKKSREPGGGYDFHDLL